MIRLEQLVRPSILKMRAYKSARSLVSKGEIFMDANESPDESLTAFNRYPEPQPQGLLQKFSALYDVAPERLLMGRGSDEAIDTLTRAVCEPGQDEILITPPTYGMYEVAADIQNVGIQRVPLLRLADGWQLDVPGMIARLADSNCKIKLVYICSPNNPTGSLAALEDVRQICRAASGKSLVVIDEAYAEFESSQSLIRLLKEFPQVVILRTLSKAWALAGLRVGVALGDPGLIQVLQKVRAPYPLPQPVTDLALQALAPVGRQAMQERVSRILGERGRLQKELGKIPCVQQIFPSAANFLLVRFADVDAVMQTTMKAGLILRRRDAEIPGCIRITVGSEAENSRLLQLLREVQP